MSQEQAGAAPEFSLPGNIHELLSDGLIVAGDAMASSRNVPKFLVSDHPDLFVRFESGNGPLEDIQAGVRGARNLRQFGVNVLPSCVVDHEGDVYIVTKFVEGEELIEALKTNPDRHLRRMSDSVWSGLSRNVLDTRRSHRQVPRDVETPGQYMFGSLSDETEQKIWLVDFPYYHYDPSNTTDYAELAFELASGIVKAEQAGVHYMRRARRQVGKVIGNAEGDTDLGKAYIGAAKYALDHQVEILDIDEDELIDRFSHE